MQNLHFLLFITIFTICDSHRLLQSTYAVSACVGFNQNDPCQFQGSSPTAAMNYGQCRSSTTGTLTCNTAYTPNTNTNASMPENNSVTTIFNVASQTSPAAQQSNLAFDAFSFMIENNFCSNTFLPPLHCADFFGFQHLRDITPNGQGHNTNFLTNVAANVLSILDNSTVNNLVNFAINQSAVVKTYADTRYKLINAFVRQLNKNGPPNSIGLNSSYIMNYSKFLYSQETPIAMNRAIMYSNIINSMNASQIAYLVNLQQTSYIQQWPTFPRNCWVSGVTNLQCTLLNAYAGEIFSWFTGNLETDTYFGPERQFNYFGGLYIKDVMSVGMTNFSIPEQVGGNLSRVLLGTLNSSQQAQIIGLVTQQNDSLNTLVQCRRNISMIFRGILNGSVNGSDPSVINQVMVLEQNYGQMDGLISYMYATTFSSVYQSLNQSQYSQLQAAKDISGFPCQMTPNYTYIFQWPYNSTYYSPAPTIDITSDAFFMIQSSNSTNNGTNNFSGGSSGSNSSNSSIINSSNNSIGGSNTSSSNSSNGSNTSASTGSNNNTFNGSNSSNISSNMSNVSNMSISTNNTSNNISNTSLLNNCSSSSPYLLLPNSVLCVPCNNTGIDYPNNISLTCLRLPIPTISATPFSFTPSINISCSQPSIVYFAYGLYSSVDNLTLSAITTNVGTLSSAYNFIPTTDFQYWVGYGAIILVNTSVNFNITNPMKNSGERYDIKVYCLSLVGSLSSSSLTNWIQPSNGATTSVLSITTSKTMSRTDKTTLGTAVKKTLNITNRMYTDNGDLVPNPVSMRVLQTSSSSLNSSNNSVSFYIVPDYSATSDNTSSIVNSAVNNSSEFIAIVTANLAGSANFTVSGVSVKVLEVEPPPTFFNTSNTLTVDSVSKSLQLVLGLSNTAGYIWVGIEPTLNSSANSSRLLQTATVVNSNITVNSTNNATNNTNSTISSSNIVYNLTLPSVAQLLASHDILDNNLTNLTMQYVVLGGNATFNFTNLNSEVIYNIYWVAGNEDMPTLYSAVFGRIASISSYTSGGGITNGSSWSEKSNEFLVIAIFFIGLMMII